MTKNHQHSNITPLEGLEAVRVRPAMYMGGETLRGLFHLVYEVVDNYIDATLTGYCNKVYLSLEDEQLEIGKRAIQESSFIYEQELGNNAKNSNGKSVIISDRGVLYMELNESERTSICKRIKSAIKSNDLNIMLDCRKELWMLAEFGTELTSMQLELKDLDELIEHKRAETDSLQVFAEGRKKQLCSQDYCGSWQNVFTCDMKDKITEVIDAGLNPDTNDLAYLIIVLEKNKRLKGKPTQTVGVIRALAEWELITTKSGESLDHAVTRINRNVNNKVNKLLDYVEGTNYMSFPKEDMTKCLKIANILFPPALSVIKTA